MKNNIDTHQDINREILIQKNLNNFPINIRSALLLFVVNYTKVSVHKLAEILLAFAASHFVRPNAYICISRDFIQYILE